ncbi:MAG: coproporphyrinogen III oxidase [Gloeocapsa sp. DLM2.Bin57]|nr:MAG: coproporphyrinogen III oxidase [Gloeocapsa sp. DLM2.Bin57]
MINESCLALEIPQAAYIHIPFCRRRCYYCDFPISVVGVKALPDESEMIREYVEAIGKEINFLDVGDKPLTTVFFGGGTPSLLSIYNLEYILTKLNQKLGIAQGAEISLEIDPGTFDLAKLQAYQELGINRLSLGVQGFQAKLLETCGRSHNLEDVVEAIALIQNIGTFNFSLDLISGLPNQTLADWEESLTKAIAANPDHLSCYDLVLEPVTVFGKRYQPGEQPLPTDTTTAAMYKLAQQMLTTAGYQHYEISNYAKPGYQCRHNRVYWENRPYYAFGMGAASYVNGVRFTRPRTRREYYNWLESNCPMESEPLRESDRVLETLMLGLRLTEGVKLSSFSNPIREIILETVSPYLEKGWVEIVDQRMRLQDPEGLLFSNTILASLFARLDY